MLICIARSHETVALLMRSGPTKRSVFKLNRTRSQ